MGYSAKTVGPLVSRSPLPGKFIEAWSRDQKALGFPWLREHRIQMTYIPALQIDGPGHLGKFRCMPAVRSNRDKLFRAAMPEITGKETRPRSMAPFDPYPVGSISIRVVMNSANRDG